MKNFTLLLISFFFISFIPNGISQTLDASFGQNGQFQDTHKVYPEGITRIAPDGSIVHFNTHNNFNFDTGAIIRYTQDGQLDPTFGTDGYLQFSLGGGFSSTGSGLVAPDGSLYVCGTLFQQPWIKKFLPDGSVDASFGNNGTKDLGDTSDLQATTMEQSHDNQIIMSHGYTSSGVARAAISKFDFDGKLNLSFANGGILYFPELNQFLRHLYITKDGDIITGYTDFAEDFDFIMKFDNDGQAVTDFGNNGKLSFGIGEDIEGRFNKVTEDEDGNLYWLGYNDNGYTVRKTDALGTSIDDFGNNGIITNSWGTELSFLSDLVLLENGGFILNGAGGTQDTSDVFLRAYLADGTIDAQFGDNGTITKSHGENETTHLLTYNKNGTILQVGLSGRFQDFEADYFANRYLYEPTLNTINLSDTKFSVYPNPASEDLNITIDGNLGISSVSIYSQLGQLQQLYNYKSDVTSDLISVSHLSSGIFILHIILEDGTAITKKWMKK